MPISSARAKANELTPYWRSECGRATVYVGDNLKVMAQLQPNTFHAVVTDPPYGLEFMGKEWDAPWKNNGAVIKDPATERGGFQDGNGGNPYSRSRIEYGRGDRSSQLFQSWFLQRAEELLRVAKPGAHLLSFGGTRMWHRMACAIEDAGFDIRDTIMWVYGCLSEDTEILTRDGWKQYQDLQIGCEVMGWDSVTEELRLETVENVTVAPYSGKMIKFHNDNTSQLLTPNHRVYKKHAQRFQAHGVRTKWFDDEWNIEEAGKINRYQAIKLPLAGYHNGTGIGGDSYAELLGWVFTEGGFDINGTGVRITQSSVNQDKVEMISACLVANSIDAKHYQRERLYKERLYTEHTWFFTGASALKVRASLPEKHPTWELLWGMTVSEKQAFFNSSMLGDGSGMAFFQKDNADREWFQTLAHCIGMQGRDNPNKLCVSLHDNATTELQSRHLKDWYEDYTGNVWCVTVKSGAFVARRNGKVFITGNSGFPKSLDISKAIDKMYGAERLQVGNVTDRRDDGTVYGIGHSGNLTGAEPITDDAKRWSGFGTALKPSFEPIIVARKPLVGTVADNVLSHGTGAMNIDACRVGTTGKDVTCEIQSYSCSGSGVYQFNSGEAGSQSMKGGFTTTHKDGRWPANLIHDGSDEVVRLLPDGADRYFYTAKANDDDRPHGKGAVTHPTVKPLDLMRYLVRLVCARGGVVLDPFMGSGSTGCAAIEEGMWFVGIEQSQEYADIAVGRLKLSLAKVPVGSKLECGTEVKVKADAPPPPKRMRG